MFFNYKTTQTFTYKKKKNASGAERLIEKDDTFDPTQEMMEELHGNGELVVLVEEDDKEMVVKFTYGDEEDEIMDLAKELKEINNKYKKNI